MKKDKTNKVFSLAIKFIQELKWLPEDDYLRIKLMLMAGAPTHDVKAFLQVVFNATERQRPLLIGTREGVL